MERELQAHAQVFQPALLKINTSIELKMVYFALLARLLLLFNQYSTLGQDGCGALEDCCRELHSLRSQFLSLSQPQSSLQRVDRSIESLDLRASKSSVASSLEGVGVLVSVSVPDSCLDALTCALSHLQTLTTPPINHTNLAISSQTASLLNIAAYTTAVLRSYTSDALERKRLLHAHCAELLTRLLELYLSNPALQALEHVEDADTFAPLVQTVGIVRNLALDKAGRDALYGIQTSAILCGLLDVYQQHAEVVVNIARVLSKLSLYEAFRAQMSLRSEHLQHMVRLVHREAEKCRLVMEKSHDHRCAGDVEDWPSWYTWPLLSRICFALGNFTNSNERNRAMIGMSFDCIASIVLLLQVCSSSLCTLTVQKQGRQLLRQQQEQSVTAEATTVFQFAGARVRRSRSDRYSHRLVVLCR